MALFMEEKYLFNTMAQAIEVLPWVTTSSTRVTLVKLSVLGFTAKESI